jgi:hypothetical protein
VLLYSIQPHCDKCDTVCVLFFFYLSVIAESSVSESTLSTITPPCYSGLLLVLLSSILPRHPMLMAIHLWIRKTQGVHLPQARAMLFVS